MKGKTTLMVAFAVIALLALAFSVTALPTVEHVRINGEIHQSGDSFVVERSEDLDIKVKLQAGNSSQNDVEVRADIIGYEYNDHERLSDSSEVFDMDAGDTEFVRLDLAVPFRAEKDSYDLRVRIGTRTGASTEQLFRLKIEGERHNIQIRDVILHPGNAVEAGSSMLVTVRLTNRGEERERDVKVTSRIPALGVEDSFYIEELDEDESQTSEELFLRIPACTEEGNYRMDIEVEFDEGFETVTTSESVRVVQGRLCDQRSSGGSDNTVITVGSQAQQVVAGKGGATFPLAIQNPSNNAKTYTISVTGVEAFGTFRVDPASTVVVNAGESKPVFLFVAANKDAAEGARTFAATISSQGESKPVQFTLNVVKDGSSMRRWAEVVLIALVVLLIILGLIIGLGRMRDKDREDDEEDLTGQTYY